MEWYKRYRLVQDKDGYIVSIYLKPNDVEFSQEFIINLKEHVSELDIKIRELVKKDFSHLKVKSVKLMVGSLVVATIPFAAHTKVLAEEASNTQVSFVEEAGITEDNVLYSVDKLLDEVKVALSFSNESKIETLVDVAEERLGEAQVLANEGNIEGAQNALEAYNETSGEAVGILEETVNKGDESGAAETSENITALEDKMGELADNSVDVVDGIKENASGEQQENLARVIEMQTAKKEAVRAMVEARHQLNSAKKEYNKAKVQLKKAEQSGDEEAIKQAQEKLAAAEENFNSKKVDYKSAFDKKQETVKEYAGNVNEDKSEAVVNDETNTEDANAAPNVTSSVNEPEGTVTDAKVLQSASITSDEKITTTPKQEQANVNKERRNPVSEAKIGNSQVKGDAKKIDNKANKKSSDDKVKEEKSH